MTRCPPCSSTLLGVSASRRLGVHSRLLTCICLSWRLSVLASWRSSPPSNHGNDNEQHPPPLVRLGDRAAFGAGVVAGLGGEAGTCLYGGGSARAGDARGVSGSGGGRGGGAGGF